MWKLSRKSQEPGRGKYSSSLENSKLRERLGEVEADAPVKAKHVRESVRRIYRDGFHVCNDFMDNVESRTRNVCSVTSCCTGVGMQIQKVLGAVSHGKLYLVATPIGNLDDMTFRAIQTLKEVDWIAAEDTRNTGLLLKHFDISTKQISFHEHNAKEKIPDLIGFLKAGQSIAQVSDAGLPSISDPGMIWLRQPLRKKLQLLRFQVPLQEFLL